MWHICQVLLTYSSRLSFLGKYLLEFIRYFGIETIYLYHGDDVDFDYGRWYTAQKMKFSIKDFLCKCDQIHRKLRIWSHLLKKSLMENFIFCAVVGSKKYFLDIAFKGKFLLLYYLL